MRVFSFTGYALCVGFSLAELFTTTPAVPAPTITAAPEVPMELFRKQNNDRFVGWMSSDGSYTSRTCDLGRTYHQSGSYWRCCSTTLAGCDAPLGCFAGSFVYRVTTSGTQTATLRTVPCTSMYDPTDSTLSICNTIFLYENTADSDALTNIGCGVSSLNWSFYRVRPDATSSSSPRSSSTSSSSTPQSTAVSTTETAGLSTTSPSSDPQPGEKESSKAWIAGVVVGPIVGLSLLGAFIFFCMRRKKTTPVQPAMADYVGPNGPAPSYPGSSNQAPNSPSAYYAHQQKQDMAPFGVASHNNWAPQSPTTQGSVLPHPTYSPYAAPPQQQWPQQGQQMYPPPQQEVHDVQNNKQPGVEGRPFSAELDSGDYQNAGGSTAPGQQR